MLLVCYQLLFVVISCYLLLSVVICCYPLLFVVIRCYLLLSVVICCYLDNDKYPGLHTRLLGHGCVISVTEQGTTQPAMAPFFSDKELSLTLKEEKAPGYMISRMACPYDSAVCISVLINFCFIFRLVFSRFTIIYANHHRRIADEVIREIFMDTDNEDGDCLALMNRTLSRAVLIKAFADCFLLFLFFFVICKTKIEASFCSAAAPKLHTATFVECRTYLLCLLYVQAKFPATHQYT